MCILVLLRRQGNDKMEAKKRLQLKIEFYRV